MSFIFYHVSVQNLLGTISSDGNRTRNFSNYSLMIAAGGFLGPLSAGFSIDHAGYRETYLYLALTALVPLAISSVGAVATVVGMLAGQLFTSLIWDTLSEGRPPTMPRIAGMVLAMAGALLSLKK
ncbi:MAG: hypothetical protein EBU49_06825 [Proteobacteria bacterium]|nr:hypothetical protein [Pseudomonadota bacterium]